MNLEVIYSAGLAVLESTFVFVGLLILHGLKRLIGSAPLYMFLGVLLVFTHIVGAAGLRFIMHGSGFELGIATSVLLLPYLGILMVVYAVDGTLAAQRLIIAAMAAFGIFAYLGWITTMQAEWEGYAMSQGLLADFLAKLLGDTSKSMGASLVSLTLDMFLIPVIFQKMKNYGCRISVCAIGALLLGQLLDSFIFTGVLYWGSPQMMSILKAEYIPRILLSLCVAGIAAIYLSRIDKENPGAEDSRRALDIVLAFFGSYGRTKRLEQDLLESEQRYHTIIQNASDMIVITDTNGIIVDANKAALEIFSSKAISDVIGCNLDEFLLSHDTIPRLLNSSENVMHITMPDSRIELELSMSRITVDGTPALVFIGRDVTERERLAKERELLRSENAHRQRLEAIGRLAGGIAHDFNNHIHAIHGHLDLIYMGEVTEESLPHLHKIDAIAEQAGKLTSQLLGYARKGKRQVETLTLKTIVEGAYNLFLPNTQTGIRTRLEIEEGKISVDGDRTQLQQAILNLMINARDAMENLSEDKRLMTIRAGSTDWLQVSPKPPADLKISGGEHYCGIRVEDTGPGVDEAIVDQIFEPFFTTKPTGKGTGMGLSMSYGVSLEHGGWIQYERIPTGAAFTLILPICAPNRKARKESHS